MASDRIGEFAVLSKPDLKSGQVTAYFQHERGDISLVLFGTDETQPLLAIANAGYQKLVFFGPKAETAFALTYEHIAKLSWLTVLSVASKAAADHLVRAWHKTCGLPVLQAHASNNYGPCQFPEKLIPVAIFAALNAAPIPVYGKGAQRRDWLHVTDHARALHTILQRGRVGETYNVGGGGDISNLALIQRLCRSLDRLFPQQAPHNRHITFVKDRPGHDHRYAIDTGKLTALGWQPTHSLRDGLEETVAWYVDNKNWWSGLFDTD